MSPLTFNVVPLAFIVGSLTHNVGRASNIVAYNVGRKTRCLRVQDGYICRSLHFWVCDMAVRTVLISRHFDVLGAFNEEVGRPPPD